MKIEVTREGQYHQARYGLISDGREIGWFTDLGANMVAQTNVGRKKETVDQVSKELIGSLDLSEDEKNLIRQLVEEKLDELFNV